MTLLESLIQKLNDHSLVEYENFNPRFAERVMKEGGGVPVLENVYNDIECGLKMTREGLGRCIEEYGVDKVETFFGLLALVSEAIPIFYEEANTTLNRGGNTGKGGRKRVVREYRKEILRYLSGIPDGLYSSKELGIIVGKGLEVDIFSGSEIGGMLGRLEEEEKEEIGFRYTSLKKWEKYVSSSE